MKRFCMILTSLCLATAAYQGAANAAAWVGPTWLDGTVSATIVEGQTIRAGTGSFYSADLRARVVADLRRDDCSIIATLLDEQVDVSKVVGYEIVQVAPRHYLSAGVYWLQFVVSDSSGSRGQRLRLIVLPRGADAALESEAAARAGDATARQLPGTGTCVSDVDARGGCSIPPGASAEAPVLLLLAIAFLIFRRVVFRDHRAFRV